jgi:hypothetical protein
MTTLSIAGSPADGRREAKRQCNVSKSGMLAFSNSDTVHEFTGVGDISISLGPTPC